MSIGLDQIGSTRPAGTGGGFPARPEKTPVKYLRSGFVWFTAALIIISGVWVLLSDDASDGAESEPMQLAMATAAEPLQPSADRSLFIAPTAPEEAMMPTQVGPVEGLKIASQSWRRGGLGSKALVTFTLRNANDYAVRDIEISCAFSRRDGSHLTDRKRLIRDTVNMKSRKTFARMHVGFVNVNADQARCSLVTASRI